ncbi:hypothetical protein PHYPSEUDO_005028 [Phytophthora pseudosyringae]|uniref:Serine-threonine/tyrosine-protein kinase catalytic domain-containing protein n=1 Tax=Phytophthora pseudosyringae TaxID=221518 RepID=A0A8T1VQT2_9STRA|nr:hypothetical protein PHYPSEUDO_005028 [Phytophthora pseudosyringae]
MPHESKQIHPTSIVVLHAGSAGAGSATFESGNASHPERTVQAPSPTSSASSSSSGGSSLTDDELGLAVGGGFMVVVMLCILVVGHRRRRRMDKDVMPEASPGTLEASTRRSPTADPQELYVLDNGSFLSSSISFGSRVSCFLQDQANQEEANESWNHPEVVAVRVSVTSIPVEVADRLRRERARLDALWSAPEVLRGERSNAKTDVFSFGVVLSELDSLASPYGYSSRFGEHDDSAELVEKVAAGHVRVHFASSGRARHGRRGSSSPAEVDPRATAAVVRLGKACVALDASERPSAAQVSAELHKLLQTPDPKLGRTLSKQQHGAVAAS